MCAWPGEWCLCVKRNCWEQEDGKTEQAAARDNSEFTLQLTFRSGKTHTSPSSNSSNFCIFTANPYWYLLHKTTELSNSWKSFCFFLFFSNAEFPLFQENETSSLALPSFVEGLHIFYSLISCFSSLHACRGHSWETLAQLRLPALRFYSLARLLEKEK